MIFVYLFFLVFFLFDVHPNISKGSFNSNYLSKETCNSIKGFCVILVFLSHCGKYIHYNKTGINEMYYSVAGYLSQLIVVMFFFYSGYGLMQQIIKKGKQYIQSFLFSRFLPTYISFVICVLFYYILSLVINIDYSCKQLLLSFTGWESIGNSNWFMFVTFVLYFIFFLSFRFVKKVSYGFVIFCFLSFLFFVILHETKEEWWWNTFLCFPVGMFWGLYKDNIEKIVSSSSKRWCLFVCLFFFLFVCFYFFSKRKAIIYVATSIIFCIFICMITMKVSLRKGVVFAFFGRHVFSIYILQRIFFIIFEKMKLNYQWYIYIPLSFLCTIFFSVIYDNMFCIIKNKLIQKYRNEKLAEEKK